MFENIGPELKWDNEKPSEGADGGGSQSCGTANCCGWIVCPNDFNADEGVLPPAWFACAAARMPAGVASNDNLDNDGARPCEYPLRLELDGTGLLKARRAEKASTGDGGPESS